MGVVAFLATRVRLPPWVIEALLVALIVAGIWLSGVFHEKARVEMRIVKQQVQVEKRVIETDHSHDQELADLRAYRDAHPVQPVRLRQCTRSPIAPQGQPSAATADVQPLPGSNPEVRPTGDPPDISGLLSLFGLRADEVSALLRRRQELEP